mmetsp:Transcript_17243/g.34990  ORF Transcript_17243/g.34990 Transcript_17243/m.34990 type:complete len:168 (+) Transcript_17243:69-572(+)
MSLIDYLVRVSSIWCVFVYRSSLHPYLIDHSLHDAVLRRHFGVPSNLLLHANTLNELMTDDRGEGSRRAPLESILDPPGSFSLPPLSIRMPPSALFTNRSEAGSHFKRRHGSTIRSRIGGLRSDQFVVLSLLKHVRGPTGSACYDEDGGEENSWDSALAVRRRRVEI